MPYEWRWGMDEVSGFGGKYEATVRSMIRAGLEWWDAHPTARPVYKIPKSFYGLCIADNPDAEPLNKVLDEAAKGEASGAMHMAAVTHILWIRQHGWWRYVWHMRWRRLRSVGEKALTWLREWSQRSKARYVWHALLDREGQVLAAFRYPAIRPARPHCTRFPSYQGDLLVAAYCYPTKKAAVQAAKAFLAQKGRT